MRKYLVHGLCKREYRGKGRDTVIQRIVEADSKKEAGEKFNKEHTEYQAASIQENKTKPATDARDEIERPPASTKDKEQG